MVVSEADVKDIMGGMQETAGVRINNKHKLRHRFDIVKKLGQGTYGKVQLAINKESGQDVAIKTIRKARIETEKDLIRIRREIQIMSSVTHPHIVHIQEVFENRDKMVLVMEYAAGGELYDYLSERKVLAEEEARRIFRQVASACYYCHKHKICHRDLKLENILLDEYGNAKLADFGLSNVFGDSRRLTTYCGSPLYASPEIVTGTPYSGPEVDCWSLGVLLYTLVYGAMPFDGSNFRKLVKQITSGEFYEPPTPSPASELIHALLTPSADARATLPDVCAHWWVNKDEPVNCLEAAEALASQTPVRLDVLLSLAPREPDKEHVMALSDDQAAGAESDSLSLNSAMELGPAEAAAATPGPPPSSPQPSETAGIADKPAKRARDESEENVRKTEKPKPEKTTKKKKKPPTVSSEPAMPALAEKDVPMNEVAEALKGVAAAAATADKGASEDKTIEPTAQSEGTAVDEPEVPASVDANVSEDTGAVAAPEGTVAPVQQAVPSAVQQPPAAYADLSTPSTGAENPATPETIVESAAVEETKQPLPSSVAPPPLEQPEVKSPDKPQRKSHVKYPPKEATEPQPAPVTPREEIKPKAEEVATSEGTMPEPEGRLIDEPSTETKTKPKSGVSPRPSPPKHDCLGLKRDKSPAKPAKPATGEVKVPPSVEPKPEPAEPAVEEPELEIAKPAEPTTQVEPELSRVSPIPTEKPMEKLSEPLAKPTKERSASPKVEVKPKPVVTPKASLHIDDVRRRSTSREPSDSVGAIISGQPQPEPKDIRASPKREARAVEKPALSRVASEGASRAAAATQERRGSEPPRRAPSKEYIIPIQLTNEETADVKKPSPGISPASSAERLLSRVGSGDRPLARSGSGDRVAPGRATEPRRPSRTVSATSSLQSLPEKVADEAREPDTATAAKPADSLTQLSENISKDQESDRPAAPVQASLTRSSRREFIIPIALEGGGEITPSESLMKSEPERSRGGLFKTHQLGGQTRLGSLLRESSLGRDRDGSGERPWGPSWGGTGLQRVSSVKSIDDRPLSNGFSSTWSSSSRRFSGPRLSGSGGSRSGSGERVASRGAGGDSNSSGGEDDDEDDQFELFTADNLFGSLMDRVRNMSRRRLGDEGVGKRSLLFPEPLRLNSSLSGSRLGSGSRLSGSSLSGQRLPSLFGAHGEVRSLFDKPLSLRHGSLFDQPPFARHSSLGSQSVGESSDSGSQQEDNADDHAARHGRTKVKTVRRTTPQGIHRDFFGRGSLFDRHF